MPDKLKGELARQEALSAKYQGTFFDLEVDGNLLRAYKYLATERSPNQQAVVVCNGYPSGVKAMYSASHGHLEPDLCDRIGIEVGCDVVSFDYRGLGRSEGDFSMIGWRRDIEAAINYACDELQNSGVALVGFRTGGAICVCVAAENPKVFSLVTLGAQVDFRDWYSDPKKFLNYNRSLGLIRDPQFPQEYSSWASELSSMSPIKSAEDLKMKEWLILHGSDDLTASPEHAEALAEASANRANLRIIKGGGHFLRYDPRATAIMLGWLERHVVKH